MLLLDTVGLGDTEEVSQVVLPSPLNEACQLEVLGRCKILF